MKLLSSRETVAMVGMWIDGKSDGNGKSNKNNRNFIRMKKWIICWTCGTVCFPLFDQYALVFVEFFFFFFFFFHRFPLPRTTARRGSSAMYTGRSVFWEISCPSHEAWNRPQQGKSQYCICLLPIRGVFVIGFPSRHLQCAGSIYQSFGNFSVGSLYLFWFSGRVPSLYRHFVWWKL